MDEIKRISPAETAVVSRAVRSWLNTYTQKPQQVNFEFLGDSAGLTLSTVQGSHKLKQYIGGGYLAEYQFKLVYRTICDTPDERLKADELLNKFGLWCENNKPTITGFIVKKVEFVSMAQIAARYEDGVEDHQISMNLIYEVI